MGNDFRGIGAIVLNSCRVKRYLFRLYFQKNDVYQIPTIRNPLEGLAQNAFGPNCVGVISFHIGFPRESTGWSSTTIGQIPLNKAVKLKIIF